MSNPTVTVSLQEYESLIEDSAFLEALQHAGVDNWEGYSHATDIFNQLNTPEDPSKINPEDVPIAGEDPVTTVH